jgi:outer membrane murein-binding lipoprotein Lpp
MRVNSLLFLSLLSSVMVLAGCNLSQTSNELSQGSQDLKSTRLHIDGFMKAKSGAI